MTIIVSSPLSVSSAALYASIRDAVYKLTNRPDLVGETELAIRKATMKCHTADFWKDDLVEVSVAPTAVTSGDTSYRYTLDLVDAVQYPRFRKISHLKEYNAAVTGSELQFTEKDANSLLDNYSLEDINYFYQAGRQVNIRTTKTLTYVLVGYWKYPGVIPAAYDSWIAEQFPDAIVEEAAAAVCRIIGKDQEATRLSNQFAENLHILTMSQV